MTLDNPKHQRNWSLEKRRRVFQAAKIREGLQREEAMIRNAACDWKGTK
jgi:hypothetical protein